MQDAIEKATWGAPEGCLMLLLPLDMDGELSDL
jgi:hypothetical protein